MRHSIRVVNEVSAKYPVLSSEEQLELFKKHSEGDAKAKELLMLSNIGLCASVAFKELSKAKSFTIEDIILEGLSGLEAAIDRFDPSKGFKFSTYAVFWIRHYQSRAILNKDRNIRLSAHAEENIHTYKKAFSKFLLQHKRSPTTKQLSKILKFSEKKIKTIEQDIQLRDCSVDYDYIEDISQFFTCTDNIVEENKRNKKLSDYLSGLTEREQLILSMRFGLNGHSETTLQNTGKVIGKTRERTRQLQVEALSKLRSALSKDGLSFEDFL